MTTMEGSSFEENPILELEEEEESWQPERAGRGVLYSIGGEGGSVRARGRESGRKSKKASKREPATRSELWVVVGAACGGAGSGWR
ncbi:hypothetical protein LTR92_011381, partial [Exophiala xenobiotica]